MEEIKDPIIRFSNVGIQFDSFVVHRNINFEINRGEAVTLLGPSGAGKTLILKLIGGLLFASHGKVEVMGREMNSLTEEGLRDIRANIGMLFQGAALFDSLSVFDNIAYGPRERGLRDEEHLKHLVAEKLEIVGLGGIEKKFPPQLSGGQKKRVGLARALATSPKIMLFDEPTTGLDPTSTRMIDELIIKLRDDHGITCVAVTHDIQSARQFSNRWLLLKEGEIVADGPVEKVANESELVSTFIKGAWKDD